MTQFELDVSMLAEQVGLILAIIRLANTEPDEDYMQLLIHLEPRASVWLKSVRDELPRPQ